MKKFIAFLVMAVFTISTVAYAEAIVTSETVDKDTGRVVIDATYARYHSQEFSISVKNPENDYIWLDQKKSNREESKVQFEFYIEPGAPSGEYTYKMKTPSGEAINDNFTVDFNTSVPVVTFLKTDKYPNSGETVTASYTYIYMKGLPCVSDEIKWYVKDGDQWNVFAEGESLSVTKSLLNKEIKFSVKAYAQDGNDSGEIFSEVYTVLARPCAKNLTIENAVAGGKIGAVYDYSNDLNYEENGSEFEWYISDSTGNNFTLIENNNNPYYLAKSTDGGKYIYYKVTPGALVGEGNENIRMGETVTSGKVQIKAARKEPPAGDSPYSPGSRDNVGTVDIVPVAKPEVKTFEDIENHWAKDTIIRLYMLNAINGRTENLFCPDDNITRAEFVKILVSALKLPIKTGEPKYDDVSENDWYYNYVNTASENALVSGYQGEFRPSQKITREEMIKITVSAFELKNGSVIVSDLGKSFNDAESISEWADSYVKKAVETEIVVGDESNMLRPKDYLTRAEAATVILRIADR